MGFLDLSSEERAALTLQAMAEHRTLVERWSDMEKKEKDGWPDRLEIIAGMLSNCRSVADIGCGLMQLRNALPSGVHYIPIDVVSRGPDTIVVDLNSQPLPALNVEGWAIGGVLEYLYDVPALFSKLTGTVVTSYNPTDICHADRRSWAWVNDYSTDELEAVFAASGFQTVERHDMPSQRIWKLKKVSQNRIIRSIKSRVVRVLQFSRLHRAR